MSVQSAYLREQSQEFLLAASLRVHFGFGPRPISLPLRTRICQARGYERGQSQLVCAAFRSASSTLKLCSRLYSERAYVLSRSFVRTALQHPPSGFEKKFTQLYYGRGRLKAVIEHAQRLIEKGDVEVGGSGAEAVVEENEEMWNADAMGSLTKGAILTLRVRPFLTHRSSAPI